VRRWWALVDWRHSKCLWYDICLGNNLGNFQLHRFTRRENTSTIL